MASDETSLYAYACPTAERSAIVALNLGGRATSFSTDLGEGGRRLELATHATTQYDDNTLELPAFGGAILLSEATGRRH